MKIIYIDSEFKCHINNDGTMTEIKTEFFEDKCDNFIEGYRFIPADATWKREDGTTFHGEMITPWKPYEELNFIQQKYEQEKLEEYMTALAIIGATI